MEIDKDKFHQLAMEWAALPHGPERTEIQRIYQANRRSDDDLAALEYAIQQVRKKDFTKDFTREAINQAAQEYDEIIAIQEMRDV